MNLNLRMTPQVSYISNGVMFNQMTRANGYASEYGPK